MFKASTSIAIRQFFILMIILGVYQKGFSQCSPCTSCIISTNTGCTVSITSSSAAAYTAGAGAKICITAGTYTGSLTINNGGVVVVGPGAVFNPSAISLFPSGGGTLEIQAGANADLPAITMNGGTSTFTLNNCGNVTCHGNILDNGSGNFLLNNNGKFISSATFTFNGSGGFPQLCNSDTIVFSGLTINGTWPGVVLKNNGYLEVTGNYVQNGQNNEVDLCPGSMLDIKGGWTSNGSVITKGLGDCAKIQVGGNSTCNGCSMQGILDLCDTTGSAPTKVYPAPKVDSNTGTWSPLITFCNNCKPNSSPTVFLNDSRVCAGSCVNLIASVSSGTPPYTYQWSPNTGTGNLVSVCPTITTTYTLVVTDQAGATGSGTSQVTVDPLPVVTTSPNTILCNGSTTNLSASGGGTYSWSPPDGLSNTTIANPTANPTTTTAYTVTVTDTLGCSSSATVTVTVVQPPVGAISVSPTIGCDSNTIYIGYGPQSIILTANSSNPAIAYQWYLNGVAIAADTTKKIVVTAGGNYNVVITDINGCVSDTTNSGIKINVVDVRCGHGLKKVLICHVPDGNPGNPQTLCIAPTGVSAHLRKHDGDCLGPCPGSPRMAFNTEDLHEVDFILYPNPAYTTLNIEIAGAMENTTFKIQDAVGREVLQELNIISTNSSEKEITISSLQPGIYFLTMQAGDQIVVKKFVKE